MNTKQIKMAIIILSIVGILDSTYLIASELSGSPVACPTRGIINCGTVLSSPYSYLFGIPVSLLGLIFFIGELIVYKLKNRELLAFYNAIGLAVIIYFLYVDIIVLRAICIYCTLVHIAVILLFIISLLYLNKE